MNNYYLTVGTNTIKAELMKEISDITITKNNIKPNGGLWLTDYNIKYQNINSWMDNITSFSKIDTIYNTKYYGNNTLAGALVVLKKDANIFVLDSKVKLYELMKHYPHSEGLFSYEKLAENYDGIYVDIFGIPSVYRQYFSTFDVSSLILFNTSPIDYYYEATIKVYSLERFFGDIILPSDYSIDISHDRKYIIKPSDEYYIIIDTIKKHVEKHWKDNKCKYLTDKRSYFIYIYNYILKNYFNELTKIANNEEITNLCYAISCNTMPKK